MLDEERGQERAAEGVIFVTVLAHESALPGVQMLVGSLRTFGGPFSQAPLWIFDLTPEAELCGRMAANRVETFPLSLPAELRGYPFAGKVAACARAEELVPSHLTSLVWISSDCLIFNPPRAVLLTPPHQAALRPVHIQNIGAAREGALNAYWREIYRQVAQKPPAFSVDSFVDRVTLYPYFNTHTFAVNPRPGLMGRWQEIFLRLVKDEPFQSGACRDTPHKIFLHQAVFSALLSTHLDQDRISMLPPTYGYPYNLQEQIPTRRRVKDLGELVSLTWEGRTLAPDEVQDIHIGERYRKWLRVYFR